MKLYSYWRSSCSWRVRIALAHKNLHFGYEAVHLLQDGGQQNAAAFLRVNPAGEVPALDVGDGVLTQSLAILEYLEERWPNPSLLPPDPLARARARAMAHLIGAGIQPLQNLRVLRHVEALSLSKEDWARHFIERGLDALDKEVERWGGAFCVGDSLSFADVCLVPQLAAARRFGVSVEKYVRLFALEARLSELAPFRAAHADHQPDTPTKRE